MGYHPRWFPSIDPTTPFPAVQRRLEELERAREDTKSSHAIAAQLMTQYNPQTTPTYSVGQKVWLEGKNITTTHPSAKLRPQRFRCTIAEVLGPVTYRVKDLPPTSKIHPVFHASLLSPYHETEEHGPNATNPPPVIINKEEQWEVDEILDAQWMRTADSKNKTILHYLVHYLGYDDSENQWRPHHEFDQDDQVVLDFQAQHPSAASLTHKAKPKRTKPRRRV